MFQPSLRPHNTDAPMAVVLSRAVVNAHSASRIALMELFKAEHFQMRSGVASDVCVFYSKNMFAFLLAFTPHFLLCKSLWLHVCVCTLSATQGDQTLCRIQHFTQDFPKVPRAFHRSIFRFQKAQRDKKSQFWKSLSASIVKSVLKLKHLRSTLGLFCMVDLEIQTLSKPNSIYILAPFRDQTTACLSYLLPTSTAVHPHRILKSSIALARPEENESPLQAQICAWNDVHLSHLTDSYLFFDFAQGIKITCMVDCCFQHGMDGHRTPVISYFTFYGRISMYFFFRTLNVQLSEAEWRRQRSCTARWAWDIHAEASSKLQLSWVLESSPKLSKKFWKKAEFTVGFSCDSVCWRSYFGFSCDCCHRFGKSFSIYV